MVRSRVLLSAMITALAIALAGCDATVYPGYAYGGYPYGGYPIYYGGTSYYGGYWKPGRSYYGGGVYRRTGYYHGGYHRVYRGGYRVH
jgi:hypothetical protein